MTEPLVSVIIPTYNRADLITRVINNLFEQTHRNIEIIVVDDGSTDDTQARLREYGERIRIVTQANAGPAAARNRGIEISRGGIIAFQDSDDLWMPTKLERQVALLGRLGESVPCCVCNALLPSAERPAITSFQNSLLHPTEQEGLWLNPPRVLMHRFLLFNQTTAVRRGALEKVGGFDETLRYMEDYDLALRLSLLGPFAFIAEPLVIYHRGSRGSLGQEALERLTCVRANIVRIRERTSEAMRANSAHAELRGPIERAVRRARRQLRVAKLGEKRVPGAATLSRLIDRADHYCGAIFDRSPWFQRMKTAAAPDRLAGSDRSGDPPEVPESVP